MWRVISAVALLAIPVAVSAQSSAIQIENAWSRPALVGHPGVVYLTVIDSGPADRLTGASSPVAETAGLHESFNDHGVMKMRDAPFLPIEPGKAATLAPNGYHIMLLNLKRALKQGDTFPVTLNFEKAGPVVATVTVQRSSAGIPTGHDAMGGMNMPGMPMQGHQMTGKPPVQ